MTDILMRMMELAKRVAYAEELGPMLTIAFGILLVFGILNCVLGYRILRFWMMLFGFGMGAALGLAVGYISGTESRMLLLIAMGAGGFALGAIAFLVYRAGIFLLGAGLGLSLSIYVLHPTTSFIFFVCMLLGVGLGVLALKYSRPVIIVGTGLFGGILAGVSMAKLLGLPQFPYGIGMSLGLAVLGMAIQFLINPAEDDEEDEDEDEEEDENDGEEEEDSREPRKKKHYDEELDYDEDSDYEDYLDDDYYIDEDKE